MKRASNTYSMLPLVHTDRGAYSPRLTPGSARDWRGIVASNDSSSQQPLADPTVNAALMNLAAILSARYGTECKITIQMGAHSTSATSTSPEIDVLAEDVVPAFEGNNGVFVVFSESDEAEDS